MSDRTLQILQDIYSTPEGKRMLQAEFLDYMRNGFPEQSEVAKAVRTKVKVLHELNNSALHSCANL